MKRPASGKKETQRDREGEREKHMLKHQPCTDSEHTHTHADTHTHTHTHTQTIRDRKPGLPATDWSESEAALTGICKDFASVAPRSPPNHLIEHLIFPLLIH